MGNLREENTLYDRIKAGFSRKYGKNLTDTAISELLGVSNHLVGKWKKGISRPSYEVLEKIRELTNAQIDYLVTGYYYDITNGDLNRDTYQYFPIYNNQQSIDNNRDRQDSTTPHEPVSGEEPLLPQLSQMAIELINELNDIHLQALKGVVTEEQFKTILAAATASIAAAGRECGVEKKKAIG